jgi:TolB-like protein/class 3 adenylate cyclase
MDGKAPTKVGPLARQFAAIVAPMLQGRTQVRQTGTGIRASVGSTKGVMGETRKLAAILVSDVAGYSRLARADEERTLARLRGLRSDLIDPAIAAHHGRIVKRTGDGNIIEFRSVVDAVRCAIEVQNGLTERNAGVPKERRIEIRVGIHVGDVVEESDGDLMGDGMNVAARLEGICEPGAIFLSEDAWRHVRDRIKEPFVDLGEQTMKNITRPMRVFALKPQSGGAAHAVGTATLEHRQPPRLSIVVLPFSNIGGDPEQEYFADGVTDSLTTDLSRIRSAVVIGRSTAFTYKGKAADVRQIGRELNVRYVLEGSVQRVGGRIRVNVQLIETEAGAHLWAERFDKPVADLLEMQDEIVSLLANRLGQELVSAEAKRVGRSPHPDSMDLYFLGLAAYHQGYSAANINSARVYFDRALEIDPDNVDALIHRGSVDLAQGMSWLTDDPSPWLHAAEAILVKALRLSPDDARAHALFGSLCAVTKRVNRGVSECERALAIDRNCVWGHVNIGIAKYVLGCNDETEAHILEALRLSPRDRSTGSWYQIVGFAKLSAGRDDYAIHWFRRAIEANPNLPMSHFLLAAASARLGHMEEAHDALRAGLELNPSFTIARFRSQTFSDNPVYLAGRERMYEGLREAGLPEQ